MGTAQVSQESTYAVLALYHELLDGAIFIAEPTVKTMAQS